MKKQFMKIALGILVSSAVITSCKKDKVEENNTEVFTTIIVKLTPVGGGAALNYQVEDLDGSDGGNAAVAQEIVLAPNKVYNVELVLLDKTKTPVDSVSVEVKEEGDDHQFYFTPSGGVNLTVTNLDKDSKNYPLGLTSNWTTGAISTGKIFILLKHKPGVKGASDPSTLGETDIDTQGWFNGFTVKIQ